MLKLRKGSTVPFPEKLHEGYLYSPPYFTANVNADKLEKLLAHFIAIHSEPLFFILELPTKRENEPQLRPGAIGVFHNDVYYIDGCTQEKALTVLNQTAEILINDGLCSFGFGCHESHDEIMVEKYNIVYIHTQNKDRFDGFFEAHGIRHTEELVTAWDTFTQDAPGESARVDTDGKSIYDIPDLLKDRGIYFAQRRET